jgi:3-isopropylmalate dehydratase small subunit
MISEINLKNGDKIRVDFMNGEITNLENNKSAKINPFYDVQKEIYLNDGLL